MTVGKMPLSVWGFTVSDVSAESSPGPTGPTGEQGTQGLYGKAGADGATGPTGERGEVGSRGPQGPEGPAGPAGPQGPAGQPGSDGSQGEQGPAGPAGPAGPQGPAGSQGIQGSAGPTGMQGSAGATGATGQVDSAIYQQKPQISAYITAAGAVSANYGQKAVSVASHAANSGLYALTWTGNIGSGYGIMGNIRNGTGFVSYNGTAGTGVNILTYNAAGTLTDLPFTFYSIP